MDLKVQKNTAGLHGCITIPADKSLSHRAVIFSSLASGKSVIENFSHAKDPLSSVEVCKELGIDIEFKKNSLIVNSQGILKKPKNILNCGNSGTTMRLMAGILAGQNFSSTLTGDSSLSQRPMKRIIDPLSLMGAKICSNNFRAPLKITGQSLQGIDYTLPVASAQVKSAILLAGLFAEGNTICREIYPSRNHTELMLKSMGANIEFKKNIIKIKKSVLSPQNITICGDISSAAYFIAAGLIIPNSKIILKNVGLNPTRTGITDVIKQMNGNIKILDKKYSGNEAYGDIEINYSPNMKGITIQKDIIPKLIDEIPIIAVLATQCEGKTVIKDAQDLRNKESDRIKTTVSELKKLGANITETPNGMIIQGKTELKGDTELETYKDHRLAMSLYTAGLICEREILIKDFEWVNISFPEFLELFNKIK